MKRTEKENLRSMLGLTQQEIAIILKVSRSQWSHYEGNRRNLPESAELRVTEMHLYMLSPKAKAYKSLLKPEYEDSKTKRIVEKRLAENHYQLIVIARKIDKAEKKVEKFSKAIELTDFLNSPEEIKKAANPDGLRSVTSTIIINFRESKSQLRLLQIDQELLQKEKAILETAIGLVDKEL